MKKLLVLARVTVFLLAIGAGERAWGLDIWINSPQNGAYVYRGDKVEIAVTVYSRLGMRNLTLFVNNSGTTWDYGYNSFVFLRTEYAEFTVPDDAPIGGYYVIHAIGMEWGGMMPADASVTVYIGAKVDTEPPTFGAGGGGGGVLEARRLPRGESASVSWSAASDNETPAAKMRYAVYCSESQATVFSGAPAKTVTGVLTTVVTGLDPQKVYYVGVRAQDEANNLELNTRTARVELWRNAADDAWLLYE